RAVVVVGPPFGAEVAAHGGALGLAIVENAAPERGMASSIALGFGALLELELDEAWLWPVDHPEVQVETLYAVRAAIGTHAAARPVCEGHGGHPPLIRRALFAALGRCEAELAGARSVLARADMIDVPVSDRGTIRDIDTVDDEVP
ncbi:MAG: NTP transferase domain-containing protein, partial [Kofleriaceae bacterium]